MQALESMLASGERPRRTVNIGLGHDEEVGGAQGAGHIAARLGALLQEHGETLDWLLDEGMTVMQGVVPGLEDPALYIGVVEKGWTMLELSVEGEQKHSSTPPRQSAVGRRSRPCSRLSLSLQESWPGPSRPWRERGARPGSVKVRSGTPCLTSPRTCHSSTDWRSPTSGSLTRPCPQSSQVRPRPLTVRPNRFYHRRSRPGRRAEDHHCRHNCRGRLQRQCCARRSFCYSQS